MNERDDMSIIKRGGASNCSFRLITQQHWINLLLTTFCILCEAYNHICPNVETSKYGPGRKYDDLSGHVLIVLLYAHFEIWSSNRKMSTKVPEDPKKSQQVYQSFNFIDFVARTHILMTVKSMK